MNPRPTEVITEEIARFAFEVFIETQFGQHAYVAFANPTAGPWKTVKLRSQQGAIVEVLRFGIKEQRPDLVVFSPATKEVVVLEAKSRASDLLTRAQTIKARDAYDSFVSRFTALRHQLIPSDIKFIPGFLWASSNFASEVCDCERALVQFWPEASRGFVTIGILDLATQVTFGVAYRGTENAPQITERLYGYREVTRF